MKLCLLLSMVLVVFIIKVKKYEASSCGCKDLRNCYKIMLKMLQNRDEVACIEDASIGISTIEIFLRAIKYYCPEQINIFEDGITSEARHIFEVVLNIKMKDEKMEKEKPHILIDAGQQAGKDSVGLALFIIEQLVACQENSNMLEKAKWIILPSTNPDGLQHELSSGRTWNKNMRYLDQNFYSVGVDISRNFDYQWGACGPKTNTFSHTFPGFKAASENETLYIKRSLSRYKKNMKLYISIRRDGHAILYPFSYSKINVTNNDRLTRLAGIVAVKVNQRVGGVYGFENRSIFEKNSGAVCGHSVDYAYDAGVPLAYELRVFSRYDNRILSKFHTLPKGYNIPLRLAYFGGIQELYRAVIKNNFTKTNETAN